VGDEAEGERGALAPLAARFVLPGIGPDPDAAIRLACPSIRISSQSADRAAWATMSARGPALH